MNPIILMRTSLGTLRLELFPADAPKTVANFLSYVEERFYDGTIVHRVIPNFMIQGGGYEPGLRVKKTHSPIPSESSNGLSNGRGTIATARAANPDSATCQFFINLKDNTFLDRGQSQDGVGQCVFGRVVEGMAVVDEIATTRTGNDGGHRDVPVEDVLISRVRRWAEVDPFWLTWSGGTVRKIAQSISDTCQFKELPILADALEDAGCQAVELLAHCRDRVPHSCGCWVVDLLLQNDLAAEN
jgi:cyclophilin family peptidyl-prolyl cis-trans isomerase